MSAGIWRSVLRTRNATEHGPYANAKDAIRGVFLLSCSTQSKDLRYRSQSGLRLRIILTSEARCYNLPRRRAAKWERDEDRKTRKGNLERRCIKPLTAGWMISAYRPEV